MPESTDEVAFFHLRDSHRRIIKLPSVWQFKLDPENVGEARQWFRTDLNDQDWQSIRIGEWWELQGHVYDGSAWYRVSIEVPGDINTTGLVLAFGAVDEPAWVWVNGESAGSHAYGVEGWQAPFEIDVAGLVRPGQKNQITVRVHDSIGAGGIWKSVQLMTPRSAE